MENLVAFIFWAIASIGFAFGDKTDLYEDNEGNIHLNCPGNLWDGRSQPKYP